MRHAILLLMCLLAVSCRAEEEPPEPTELTDSVEIECEAVNENELECSTAPPE